MNEDVREYLTPREVAARLRLSLRSIYRLLAGGKIVGLRRGEHGAWLIRPEDADAFLVAPRGPVQVPSAAARREHERAVEQLRAAGYRV